MIACRLLLLTVVFALALTGCYGIKWPTAERRDTALQTATETYRKLMRWGYYEEAVQYLKAKDGAVPQPDLKNMSRYKVTGYQMGEQLLSDTGEEARVIASIDYYDVETGIARTVRDEQYWWYDREKNRWYLGSPMPDFSIAAVAR